MCFNGTPTPQKIAWPRDSKIKLSFDILATWLYFSRTKYNTKSTKKCRKQVIKTFSMREGWWYIGIKGGGGVKSKGTRIVIEKEK